MRKLINLFALAALMFVPAMATAQSDSCAITISGTDVYGDGWNGAQIAIVQNGMNINTFTVSGSSTTTTFNVGSNAPVKFVWTSGTYDSETSFEIKNNLNETLYSHSGAGLSDTFYTATVPCPSCAAPSGLTITNPTNEGATLSWTAGGEESSWVVWVNGEAIATSPVSETSVDLSGLDANTIYSVEVFASCDDGNTSSAASGTFKTLCQNGNCELTLQYSGSSYYAGSVKVWQNGGEIATVTSNQTVEICNGDSVILTYVVSPYGSYSAVNWTVIDAGDSPIATFDNTHSTGDTVLAVANGCPSCIPPSNIQVSNITADGATFHWTSNNGETEWVVYIDSTERDEVASDGSVDITGLEANHVYTFRVRAVCVSGEDTSNYRSITFRTACEGAACDIRFETEYVYYAGSLHVFQSGSEIAYITDNQTLSVCDEDSITLTYVQPDYASSGYGWSIYDVADVEIANIPNTGSTGDTVATIADACPSCIPPSAVYVIDSTIGQSTADIHWYDPNFDGSAEYEIYVNGEYAFSVSDDTVYTLTDLPSSSSVTIGVKRVCEEGDSSALRTVTFRTACGPVTLPYFETFEGLGFTASNGLIVPCWIRDENYTSTTSDGRTFPCGSTSGSNATMGFAGNVGDTIYICTDTIPVAGDSVFVSFKAQPSGNVDFWCGVMSDPHDSSTFIPIGAGIHTTNGNNTWGEYLFSTVGFSSEVSYRVAFKYTSATGFSGNWVNIDDIEIDVFDGCIRPTELAVTDLTAEGATLDWLQNGTEESWVLYVNDEEPIEITEKPYTLTGLDANSVYTVTLRALCVNGDTTSAELATSTTFRTACPGDTCQVTVSTTGYSMSEYELIQNGFSFGLTTNPSVTYNICNGSDLLLHTTYATSSYSFTVTNAAQLELYSGMVDSSTYDTLNIGQPCPTCMPAMNLAVAEPTADGGVFTWQPMDSSNVTLWHIYVNGAEVGTATDTSYTLTGLDANTFYTVGVRADCGDDDSSALRNIQFRTACSGGNCTFSVTMTDSYGDGWTNNAINVYQNGEVFESLTLTSGTSLTVTSSPCLGEPVALIWQTGTYAYESSFTIMDASDSVLLIVNGADQCTNGDTLVVFDGACNANVIFVPDTTTPGPGPGPTDCNMPTGLTTSADVNSATVSFNGTASSYEVEIVVGSWQGSMGGQVSTNSTSYTFTNLQPSTAYTIGVRAICGTTRSDWATVSFTTDSNDAPCVAPTALDTVNVDSNRATITWTAGGSETQWQIRLGTSQDYILTSTNTYTLNNLTPATEYRVRVRAYCSESVQSGWSAELVFTTDAHNTDGIEAVDGMNVSLYPNPASSTVTIEAAEAAEVSIIDLNGREVYRSTNSAVCHRIDVATLAKGTYFVRLTGSENTAVRKLVVK